MKITKEWLKAELERLKQESLRRQKQLIQARQVVELANTNILLIGGKVEAIETVLARLKQKKEKPDKMKKGE